MYAIVHCVDFSLGLCGGPAVDRKIAPTRRATEVACCVKISDDTGCLKEPWIV